MRGQRCTKHTFQNLRKIHPKSDREPLATKLTNFKTTMRSNTIPTIIRQRSAVYSATKRGKLMTNQGSLTSKANNKFSQGNCNTMCSHSFKIVRCRQDTKAKHKGNPQTLGKVLQVYCNEVLQ